MSVSTLVTRDVNNPGYVIDVMCTGRRLANRHAADWNN